jgi:hypothetical protein
LTGVRARSVAAAGRRPLRTGLGARPSAEPPPAIALTFTDLWLSGPHLRTGLIAARPAGLSGCTLCISLHTAGSVIAADPAPALIPGLSGAAWCRTLAPLVNAAPTGGAGRCLGSAGLLSAKGTARQVLHSPLLIGKGDAFHLRRLPPRIETLWGVPASHRRPHLAVGQPQALLPWGHG